jgi:hypothetical protein
VTVLLPERKYGGIWRRLLHDQTADGIERSVSRLPHANVTTVPFHFESRKAATRPLRPARAMADVIRSNGHAAHDGAASTPVDGALPIAAVRWRQRVVIEGRISSVRVRPLADIPSLEVVLSDGTGSLSVVFHGRRHIEGVGIGTTMRVEGTAIDHHGRLAILNPHYTLLAVPNVH